jgi:hypothetical protein
VKNKTPNSLARITLRWMIRECLRDNNTSIIFDAHMLKFLGLDIDHIDKAPAPILPQGKPLRKRGPEELPGFRIHKAIASGLQSPFLWGWDKMKNLVIPKPKTKTQDSPHNTPVQYIGEAQQELDDALSPIYDQLELHLYWKVMEWFPCESPPLLDLCV